MSTAPTAGTTTATTTADGGAPGRAPAALLQLLRLASPALPVGGFSYSEGLAAAVDGGLIVDEAAACAWLIDQLHLALARSELPIVAAALQAWRLRQPDRIDALNAWFLTTRETSELRQQSEQMGRSLLVWLRNRPQSARDDARVDVLAALLPAPSWPIAFALAACDGDAPVSDVLLGFGFGWAENMVQAAIKAVPLGQLAGQRILAALCAELPAAVAGAPSRGDAERQAHAPMQAILSARHETQYSRLFRS